MLAGGAVAGAFGPIRQYSGRNILTRRNFLHRLLRSILQLTADNYDGGGDHQCGVESNDRVRWVDHIMQNSLCMLWMTMAFVSLSHRGRKQ